MHFEYHIGILGGGKSKRFGSNKLLYVLDNNPLLLHILMEIPKLWIHPASINLSLYDFSQYEDVIAYFLREEDFQRISYFSWIYNPNNNPSSQPLTIDIVLDTYHGISNENRAAIFGIQSICKKIKQGYLQIIPCDSPNFDATAMNCLLGILLNSSLKYEAIIPQWNNGFIEPLHSLFNVLSVRKNIDKNIGIHEYAVRKIFSSSLKVYFLEIEKELSPFLSNKNMFQNLNEVSLNHLVEPPTPKGDGFP